VVVDRAAASAAVQSAAERVHARVRDAILSGEFEQGAVLSQVQLAKQLGVSRTPLREALRMLQVEGFIDAVPNRRVRVARFSIEGLEQLYAMRISIEGLALRLSVPHFTELELQRCKGYLEEMDRCVEARDVVGWDQPHRAFHRALIAHAGQHIRETADQLADRADRYRRLYVTQGAGAWGHTATEHRAILAACAAGDAPLASAELARHYTRTALTVLALVAPEHDPATLRMAVSLTTAGAPGPSGAPARGRA